MQSLTRTMIAKQIAYMMADISKVDLAEVHALYAKLEVLSCEIPNSLMPFGPSLGSSH